MGSMYLAQTKFGLRCIVTCPDLVDQAREHVPSLSLQSSVDRRLGIAVLEDDLVGYQQSVQGCSLGGEMCGKVSARSGPSELTEPKICDLTLLVISTTILAASLCFSPNTAESKRRPMQ